MNPAMSYPEIDQLVPHEGDMILLDRVLFADADNLSAEVRIHVGSLLCDGAGVGSWVGLEYMAQAIAAHAGYKDVLLGEPIKVGFLLGARRYQVAAPLFALGTVLHVHVHQAILGENGLAAFECRIEDAADGSNLANATVTVFVPNNVNEFLQRSFS